MRLYFLLEFLYATSIFVDLSDNPINCGEDMSSVKKKRKYKIAKHKRKKRSRRDRHKGK